MFKRVYVEITNVCNLSCSFCPGTGRPARFLAPAEFRILAERLRGHTEYLYLHVMGEPLLHPQLEELLAVARELGFRVCVTTNGTLLPRRGQALSGVHKVSVSLHSFEGNDCPGSMEEYLSGVWDFCRRASAEGTLCALRLWNIGGRDSCNGQVLAFLEGELGRVGVAIERATSPGLWVRGDKDLLYRAIYNILVNGQQAMDGPGIIRISSRRSDDGRVVLEALDSGPGFDPALLDSVLDPFFTTKDGGTGLGLPIVSSIINSHGGEIRLANGPEGGALVRILLPAAEPEKPEEPEIPAAAAEAQSAPAESGEAAARPVDDRENGTPEPGKES